MSGIYSFIHSQIFLTITLTPPYPTSLSECHPGFKLLYGPADGLSSRCPHLITIRGKSEAECLEMAYEIGATAVNVKRSRCYAKRCKDSNLKLVSKYKGWKVFAIRGEP